MSARSVWTFVLVPALGLCQPAFADAPLPRQARGADISFGSLNYYAECVNAARDTFAAQRLDRLWHYRCDGDAATAYFNYLGRRNVRDVFEQQAGGLFIVRTIRGKGRCWNWVADEFGRPVSVYGCDIFEEI